TPQGVQTTFAAGLYAPQGLAFNAAGDLFVAGGNQLPYIYEYTPAGVQTVFTTQVNNPIGLAFNSTGNLFEADANSGNIYEFTPAGTRTTFATGLSGLTALAFNQAGDLLAGTSSGIYEFAQDGTKSLVASEGGAGGLAVQPAPEPSMYALFGIGLLVLVIRLYKNAKPARA
ncbi:MAG: PEP-CTERM sorting domain-containing protein, partial [Limisphaerales bacterium]